MLMPKRNKDETPAEFVDRCMDDAAMVKEFPDVEQRRTVCERQAQAEASGSIQFVSDPGGLTIEAEAEDVEAAAGSKPKLPRFSMVAYTGGPMRLGGWKYPVVVDLAGLAIPSQQRPIRFGHEVSAGVGHTDRIEVVEGQLLAGGVISRGTPAATEIVVAAHNGFPWQASIGASVEQFEFVHEDQTALVNGQEMKGPLNIIRKSTLGEISFVDLGADDHTSARVAAKAADTGEQNTMDPNKQDVQGSPPSDLQGIGADGTGMAVVKAARKERERREGIEKLVLEYVKREGSDLDRIEAIGLQAIQDDWTLQTTELELIKATRPKIGITPVLPPPAKQDVLAAGLLIACGVSDEKLSKDRDFGANVVEEAWKLRRIGMHDVLAACLRSDGVAAPHGASNLYDAVVNHQIKAGFSTVDLTGLLGTVGNKILLNAFTAVDVVYERIAQQADFNNFLTYTQYRLDHTGGFEKVGADGELKHGKLAESSYTNRLATSGQMLTLTREAIVNDDLNAMQSLYGTLGRKARLAVEKALFSGVLMEAADVFYTAGQGNKLTATPLSVAGLGAAETAMLAMVDADGDPIYASPKILLTPPASKFLALQLYSSARVNEAATAGSAQGVDNPYAGRFAVESSPFMPLATMTGASASDWYLLADPNVLPAFQVAYLQGKRAPTIETADAQFNTLGVQMRCFFDFGVAR